MPRSPNEYYPFLPLSALTILLRETGRAREDRKKAGGEGRKEVPRRMEAEQ